MCLRLSASVCARVYNNSIIYHMFYTHNYFPLVRICVQEHKRFLIVLKMRISLSHLEKMWQKGYCLVLCVYVCFGGGSC